MPLLWRMQPPGSTNRLTYAVRGFYGVNSLAASPTDYDGVNEALDWTRRVESAVTAEHTTSGVHKSRTIPAAVIVLDYDYEAGTYTAAQSCYSQGTTGAAVVSAVSIIDSGIVQVTLATALPTSNISVVGLMGNVLAIMLAEVTSTTVFKVVSYQAVYANDYWWDYQRRTGPLRFAVMATV